jgi:hypothetical protein
MGNPVFVLKILFYRVYESIKKGRPNVYKEINPVWISPTYFAGQENMKWLK